MRRAFLLVITVCLAGCVRTRLRTIPRLRKSFVFPDSREAGNLTFYDDSGNPVATARLSLPTRCGQNERLFRAFGGSSPPHLRFQRIRH